MCAFRNMLALVAISIALTTAARAVDSVYTDLIFDKCKTLVAPDPDEPGGDFVSMSCPGYKDYTVLFKEGDLRQSVHYGFLTPKIIDKAFASFGPFNHMNPKVEWRVSKDGRPIAAIQRFFVGDAENQGQVLVVSKVGHADNPVGCPAGYVDAIANKDANTLARKVADDLANFRCGKDEARYHGIKGAKAGDPMNYDGSDE